MTSRAKNNDETEWKRFSNYRSFFPKNPQKSDATIMKRISYAHLEKCEKEDENDFLFSCSKPHWAFESN